MTKVKVRMSGRISIQYWRLLTNAYCYADLASDNGTTRRSDSFESTLLLALIDCVNTDSAEGSSTCQPAWSEGLVSLVHLQYTKSACAA